MADVVLTAVSFTFPGGGRAVDGVSLAVPAGEGLAILGPSGCGKTTLLRLVAGLEFPTAGEVRVGGREVSRVRPEDRGVAIVPQVPVCYPQLSVRDNLGFALRFRPVAKDEAARRVKDVAAGLGLSELLDRMPHQLSGGQRQRVSLGRALVRRPAVLLLDEPLAHLDVPLRAAVRDAVTAYRKQYAMTTLWVTHDPAEADAAGDWVGEMEAGKLLSSRKPTLPIS
jgi:ABC-type sugar transport system ATPase subunit